MNDTRDRNQYFRSTDIGSYLKEYSGSIAYGLNRIDEEELKNAKTLLATAHRIFVAGNGGSAAISDHLCCDFMKGTDTAQFRAMHVHSLVGSQALFSAIGNDLGYEKVFSHQLKLLEVNSGDVVVLISSSGNSQNIIEAALYAQSRKAYIVGLTGFDGGQLSKLSDARLHIPVNNYGVVEDCHQALMHILAQFIYLERK